MNMTHASGTGGFLEAVLLLLAALAMGCYVQAVVASRRRGRPWPWHRVALWCGGIAAATASVIGPLATAAHAGFTGHIWAHLLGGMLAPLLLVLAAPVTLALRTLAVTPARRLSWMLRSRAARLVTHPITAGALSAGGLWLIYLTPVVDAMRGNHLLHVLVHAHLLASGFLLTAAFLRIDPQPHPPPRSLVAAVLILTTASHSILAKYLYAHPPAGMDATAVRDGAQLMYYAGAWIEAVVIVIFCAQWYRAASPTRRAQAKLS